MQLEHFFNENLNPKDLTHCELQTWFAIKCMTLLVRPPSLFDVIVVYVK